MTIKASPLAGPIEDKIVWAENCYRKAGGRLLEDEGIADLLKNLKAAARASHSEMIMAGMVNECRDCEQKEGGSCCGEGLENKYSGTLLLINLLLEKKLPRKRYDLSSCYFLGRKGCLLLARHVICVNYICDKITDRIEPEKIVTIREKEGVELETLFLLNERIRKILNTRNTLVF